jgi:hypothetical protein
MHQIRSRIARHRWLTLVVALLGCDSIVDPPLPPNTVPMTAPGVYSIWWNMVESCSGITRPLAAVRWFEVSDTDEFKEYGGELVSGYWSAPSNEIVVAGASVLEGSLIRHEMLHALLRHPGHPRSAFLGSCDGMVVCELECAADARTDPPTAFQGRLFPSDSIQVAYHIDPASPSASANDGMMTITVIATNPTSDSVTAILSPRGVSGHSFSAGLNGPRGGIGLQTSFNDSSLVRFTPHQTKQAAFDFRIGTDSTTQELVPGEYGLIVAYGNHQIFQMIELRP